MKTATLIFALLLGLHQNYLFSIITPAEGVITSGYDCSVTGFDDSLHCVSCDTIGKCDSGTSNAIIEKKCAQGEFCNNDVCGPTPQTGCEIATVCPDNTGCYPDPLTETASGFYAGYIDCSESSFVLCTAAGSPATTGPWNDPSAPAIVVGDEGVCNCDGYSDITCSAAAAEQVTTGVCEPSQYLPPGSPYNCGEISYLCTPNALLPIPCDTGCFDLATCVCGDPPTTEPAPTTEPTPTCPPCEKWEDDVPATNTGYYECYSGTEYNTSPLLSCETVPFWTEICDCGCFDVDTCAKIDNGQSEDPAEYIRCSKNSETGENIFTEATCDPGYIFDQEACNCITEPTTLLPPGVTEPSNCAEFDVYCPVDDIRPNDADSATYFACIPGAEDFLETCPVGQLFLIDACGCVDCENGYTIMPGHEDDECITEYYYCDLTSKTIFSSNCKNLGECFDSTQNECVPSTAPTDPPTVEGQTCGIPPCNDEVNPNDEACWRNCDYPAESFGCCEDGKIYNETTCGCTSGASAMTSTTDAQTSTTSDQTSSTTSDSISSTTSDSISTTTHDPDVPTPPPGMTTTCGFPDTTCAYGEVTSTTNHSDYVNCDDFTRIFYCSVGNEFLYKCCRCGGACTKNVELYHLDFDD